MFIETQQATQALLPNYIQTWRQSIDACQILQDLQRASLEFGCAGEQHSSLTFHYWGDRPVEGQELRFFVDGALYQTYGSTYSSGAPRWVKVHLIVPQGVHTYRWEASTDVAGRPPFRLDSLRCVNAEPTDHRSADAVTVDFDEHAIPAEVNGSWIYNNGSYQSGDETVSISAQAPLLDDLGKSSLEFACGDAEHTALTFFYWGDRPAEGQVLRLFLDERLYAVYGSTYSSGAPRWTEVSIAVPQGTHSYRWEVETDQAGRPPYRLDSVRCLNIAPKLSSSPRINFDAGFIPPEITGDWDVANGAAESSNELRAHSASAPILDTQGIATLEFDCAGQEHSKLTFFYWGDRPAEGQELRFYVDDELHNTFASTYSSGAPRWTEIAVALERGLHRYRWEASTAAAGHPPFRLDTFTCE